MLRVTRYAYTSIVSLDLCFVSSVYFCLQFNTLLFALFPFSVSFRHYYNLRLDQKFVLCTLFSRCFFWFHSLFVCLFFFTFSKYLPLSSAACICLMASFCLLNSLVFVVVLVRRFTRHKSKKECILFSSFCVLFTQRNSGFGKTLLIEKVCLGITKFTSPVLEFNQI